MTTQLVRAEQLSGDLFALIGDDQVIVYAPLRGKAFPASYEGLAQLRQYYQDGGNDEVGAFLSANGLNAEYSAPVVDYQRPFLVSTLTLSLTSACNLRCIYCYAKGGYSPKNMKWQVVKTSIDSFLAMLHNAGRKKGSILFHGGGEPTVAWKMMQKAVEYAVGEARQLGINLRFAMVTNGTLITAEWARWLAQYPFRINVSLDGTQKIQDRQRPTAQGNGSFDLAMMGVQNLKACGITFSIRATVTGTSVGDMLQMVRLAKEVGAGSIAFEPFTPSGRGESGLEPVDPITYIPVLLQAIELAKSLGIGLKSSSLRYGRVTAEFCGACGNIMCVIPTGHVTSCTRVTRQDDQLFPVFQIGEIGEQGQLVIDPLQVEALRHMTVQDLQQCDGCPAKWSCAGGCYQARLIAGGEQSTTYCQIVLGTLWNHLSQLVGVTG